MSDLTQDLIEPTGEFECTDPHLQEVRNILAGIPTTLPGSDLLSSGMARNIRVVDDHVYLRLFAGSDQGELSEIVRDALDSLSWSRRVYVDVRSITGVKRTIAVGSGKGGVGKTSVALGLAASFVKQGLRVGLLDADVYGPNIPILLDINPGEVATIERDGETRFVPALHQGIRVMSVGMLAERHQSLAWRGPILTRLLQQFLYQVDWGTLDVLLIDLPPGTGDAQITILQESPVAGVLLVSTPGASAWADLIRTVTMYRTFGMPLLGLVENMVSFCCPCCSAELRLLADSLPMEHSASAEAGLELLASLSVRLEPSGLREAVGAPPRNAFLHDQHPQEFASIARHLSRALCLIPAPQTGSC